jgi:hypothetical protein
VETSEPFLFRSQMKLREEGSIFECRCDHTLAQRRDRFRHEPNVLLFFRRKKKWPEEWTMNAIAEGELGIAEAGEELIRKLGRIA